MASVFVATYSLRVREKLAANPTTLQFEAGASLYDNVNRTLVHLKTCQRHPTEPHVIRVTKLHGDGTDLWGLVERGEYGYGATGIHSQTFEPSYKRSAKDAELIPLYFRFHLPATATTGILILQRLGVHGAYSDLLHAINENFREAHKDYFLGVGPFVPTSVIETLAKGDVREISIQTHSIPKDIADRVKLKGNLTEVGTVEIKIRAKRQRRLFGNDEPAWLKKLRKGEGTVAEMMGDDTKRVRLRVDYNGRERMYDFERVNTAAPYIDITSEVQRTSAGHPQFDSIDEYAVGLRDELIEQLGQEA